MQILRLNFKLKFVNNLVKKNKLSWVGKCTSRTRKEFEIKYNYITNIG